MNGISSRYTVIPKQCLDVWVESVGVSKLNDEICGNLAEDATYRIREAVHNAVMFMKHAKRTCLTTEDFNNSLKEMNTEIIYGHGDAEGLVYKAIPFRDSRVCYIDEKDKNLREIALDSVYPLDSGETSLKAHWLTLEGKLCNTGNTDKVKEELNAELNEPIASYFSNITSALLNQRKHLRKAALMDLQCNKKLQVVLPHLISFLCTQVKLASNKKSTSIFSFVLLAVNALIENDSILLMPYLFQLMKTVLFIVADVKLSIDEWSVHHTAALIIIRICKKFAAIQPGLSSQLFKTLKERLRTTEPVESLFGVIAAIRFMGTKAINEALVPVLKNLTSYINTDNTEPRQKLVIQDSICDAIAILFPNDYSLTEISKFDAFGVYDFLYECFGESFLLRCLHVNHINFENKNIQNGNNLQLTRQSSVILELIKEKLFKLEKTETKLISPVINQIFKMVDRKVKFELPRKRKLNGFIQMSGFQASKRKVSSSVMKGRHSSFIKKSREEFTNIYLPIL